MHRPRLGVTGSSITARDRDAVEEGVPPSPALFYGPSLGPSRSLPFPN